MIKKFQLKIVYVCAVLQGLLPGLRVGFIYAKLAVEHDLTFDRSKVKEDPYFKLILAYVLHTKLSNKEILRIAEVSMLDELITNKLTK